MFATTDVIIDRGKEDHWMLKPLDKRLWEQDVHMVSKDHP